MENLTIKIDWNRVDRMLEAGAEGVGIAERLGISYKTLQRRCKKEKGVQFVQYKAQKREAGNVLLQVKQFDIAMAGNVAMLIFLGKQRLGQSEKQDVTTEGKPITPLYFGSDGDKSNI